MPARTLAHKPGTTFPYVKPYKSTATKTKPNTMTTATTNKDNKTTPNTSKKVTPFQETVYNHLMMIPKGSVTTYAALARALNSSPRAVGGALRVNPFAPEVPCHRVIAADGYVGGFKGDWEKAPSGVNQSMKLDLLKTEGVEFTKDGKLIVREGVWFDGPWELKSSKMKAS